jgi:hypothetical protein
VSRAVGPAAHAFDDIALHGDGLAVAALPGKRLGEVVADADDHAIAGVTSMEADRLVGQALRLVIAPLLLADAGQVAAGPHGIGIGWAERLHANRQRRGEMIGSAIELAERPIGVADRATQIGLGPREAVESIVDRRGRGVEHLPHANLATAGVGRRRGEHLREERGDDLTFAPRRFGDRSLALGAHEADRGADESRENRAEEKRRRKHRPAMAADELPGGVRAARRRRPDGLPLEESGDIVAQFACALVAPTAILVERLHHDPVEFAAHDRSELARLAAPPARQPRKALARLAQARARRGRLDLTDDPLEFAEGRRAKPLAVEGRRAGEQFIHKDADRIDIGSRIDIKRSLGLLRTHVFRRADELAMLGEERALDDAGARRLGDAEVDDAGEGPSVLRRDENIRRLQVAVDDSLLVGVMDRPTDLHDELETLGDGEAVRVAVARDRIAGAELHHEIGPAAGGGAGIEHLRDVRMVHEGEGLPLLFEARDDLPRIHAELDDLERDLAPHRRFLLGHEDDAEAALADLLKQAIGAEPHPRHLGDLAGGVPERTARLT